MSGTVRFANPPPRRLTMREQAGIPRVMAGERLRSLAIQLFVVTAAGAVLGAFGPFGSYVMPAPARILYWIGFLLAGFVIFRPLTMVGRWLAAHLDLPRWSGTGLGLALGAIPVALLVRVSLVGFDWDRGLRSNDFGAVYAQVMLIGVLINGLFHLLGRRSVEAGTAHADDPDVVQASVAAGGLALEVEPGHAFARRLPPGFGPLLALAGEDHYVRAIAPAREELVLVRLRDAVAELAGRDGMQVHRSWWVAREAVREVRRDGRAITLVLANGRQVPVAREKVPVLRQSGWL